MKISTLNTKTYPLACDEALATIQKEIEILSLSDCKVLKIIHGYGSSGVGGVIKKELSILLKDLCKQGKILDFVANERFVEPTAKYKRFTKLYPELILDSDLQNQNPGITLIFLN